VLITNDNGIEDVKIVELARAFSEIAETYVVAPLEDRSGSTHYLTVTQRGSFRVERRQIGKGIHAYAVDGFPADCVVLALTGIMKDSPPDLVISGINGGPNLGKDWLFSGTIGAARVGIG
jgi:5'-nucleotidase